MDGKQIIDYLNSLVVDLDKLPQAFGDEFLKAVKQKTPVESGTLQQGWNLDVEGPVIEVSNEVPYAHFVEDGTEKMAPVGMLKATILEAPQILDRAWKKVRK
ncbi:HK97 gp10 family phage protein [Aquabacterium sp.]|uniref:HK97 gp10 family phage protein n=1 Tax=Aquabacterium sp. TaxID=1872578 RepID=UPI003D6D6F22